MSVQSTTTFEFNRREAHLSSSNDDSPPYTIHGVALGADDVTHGSSGVRKLWPTDELRESAETLQGKDLVVDHDNSASGVVGRVTKSGFKNGVGVIYEAELYDEELAQKIRDGLLEVSIRGYHIDVDDMEETDDGVSIVEQIEFDNLSIVPNGAAPSNTLQLGEHAELSVAELAAFTETLDELQEIDLSDFVQWGDNHGIVFAIDDNTATVEVMEEVDEKWRSVSRQEEVSLNDLEMWDIDDSDIGAPKDEEESAENMSDSPIPMPEDAQLLYPTEEKAVAAAKEMGIEGSHSHMLDGDEWYMPGETHEVFIKRMREMGDMEGLAETEMVLASYSENGYHGMDEEENRHTLIRPNMKFYSKTNDSLLRVIQVDGNMALMEAVNDSDGSNWYETVPSIYRSLDEGTLDYHDPDGTMPLLTEGLMLYSTTNNSVHEIVSVDGDTVTMSAMDSDSMWDKPADEVIEDLADGDARVYHPMRDTVEMSDALYKRGDWVEWNTRNSTEIGTVYGSYQEGDDMPDFRGSRGYNPESDEVLYALRMYKKRDGMWHPIDGGLIGHYEKSVRLTDEPSNVSDTPVELNGYIDEPEFESGMMVHWQANPDMFGRIVHVPENDDIVMVELHDFEDGELVSTGYTVTAGYGDVQRMRSDMFGNSDASRNEEHLKTLEDEMGLQTVARLAAEPMVSRPEGGDRRATFHTPLPEDATEDDMMEAVSIAEDEIGKDISVSMSDAGVFVEPISDTGVGAIEFMHPHLDIIEAAFDNTTDIRQKSTIFIGGNAEGYSIQPCFMMDERLPDSALDEISRLYEFVTGVATHAYYNENRLYLDTRQNSLAHANLDVAEILVRRTADDAEIGIQSHSFKVLEETTAELGRSNVDQYEVEEEDWAQWYPSEMSERHGFVTSVDDGEATITVWEQDDDGKWRETDERVTKSMEEVEPWGNFPRKQEDFAIDGADPRRAVRPSEEAQDLSEQTETALRNKVEAHNKEYGDEEGKRVTYRKLKAVYNRGGGAYDDSHREGMSRQQWSMARVNAFLYLVRNGNPENDAYVQDNDLLPDEHPRATSEENALYGTPASLSEYDYVMGAPELEFGELASMDELDVVYSNWTEATNMTASELRRWSKNPCSREASIDPTAVIKRNLRLLETDKEDWDRNDIRDAKRTVSFIARMRGAKGQGNQKTGGSYGCPTDWASSLLNWAYNPFDSLPEAPNNDALDDVEVVELMDYEMHEVEFDGVTTEKWNPVSMDDFETDDLEEISKHFMVSSSGFPPENYRDLKMPVVGPDGNLNLNALEAIKGGVSPSAAEGLESGLGSDLGEYINQLAEEEFDKNWSTEEAMMYNKYKSDESHMFPNRVDAMMMARQLGLDGVHKMGGMFMPGRDHEAYMDAVASMGYGYGDDDEMEEEEEEEMADSESLMEYDMHEPSYEGTTEADWSAPTLEDIMMAYEWDDEYDSYDALPDEAKETVGNHFIISESGFPAENFGDYKLPVVSLDGELSLNALNAVKGGRGVSAVEGLNSEMEDTIVEMVNELANEEFDKEYGMQEEMASIKPVTIDGVTVFTSDDLRRRDKSEESETDSTTSTMNNVSKELQARLEELEAPAVMEQGSFDELREKAEKYDDISEDIAELRERTEVLDDVDRTLVDELSEANEPMVIESARFEALSDEAEQVKEVYATQLEDELSVFSAEELMDKFTIEELSEKYEDAFGEFEEELSPDPKGTDASEEELAKSESEEELAQDDAVAQKQQQIREQIFKR